MTINLFGLEIIGLGVYGPTEDSRAEEKEEFIEFQGSDKKREMMKRYAASERIQ